MHPRLNFLCTPFLIIVHKISLLRNRTGDWGLWEVRVPGPVAPSRSEAVTHTWLLACTWRKQTHTEPCFCLFLHLCLMFVSLCLLHVERARTVFCIFSFGFCFWFWDGGLTVLARLAMSSWVEGFSLLSLLWLGLQPYTRTRSFILYTCKEKGKETSKVFLF